VLTSRPDVEHQKKQLPFKTQRTHSSLTVPQIIQQTNQGIESLEAEEGGKVEQPLTRRRRAGTRSLPGGEGQALEAYQEEKGTQESNQEEKGKLEANHHSSASSNRPIPRPQLQNSSQQVDNFASHISLPVQEIMHSWVLLNIPQTCKVVLCQVHYWECYLSQIETTRVAASACASLASLV
jgi:hypothetical protein